MRQIYHFTVKTQEIRCESHWNWKCVWVS